MRRVCTVIAVGWFVLTVSLSRIRHSAEVAACAAREMEVRKQIEFVVAALERFSPQANPVGGYGAGIKVLCWKLFA